MHLLALALAIAGSLLALLALAVRVVLVVGARARRDPRARWQTDPEPPIWFEIEGTGERVIPAARGRLVLGAAGDAPVPGARPRHALVRVFSSESADIAPIDRAPLRIAGRRARGPTLVREGDRVALGRARLLVHLGWLPDPADPRIGSVVAGERLLARLSPRRYRSARCIVELHDPPVDAAAHAARVAAAIAAVPTMLRARRVEAGAIAIDAARGSPHAGRLAPSDFIEVCRSIAALHRVGIAHGGPDDAILSAPGWMRLSPVAPAGAIADDLAALRRRTPEGWPDLAAADARALLLAALRHGAAVGALASLARCERCGEAALRASPPRTTMFDGFDPRSGRAFGGRTTERRRECLACGHVDVELEQVPHS